MAHAMVSYYLQGEKISSEVATMLLGKHGYFIPAIEYIAECHGNDCNYRLSLYVDDKNKIYTLNLCKTRHNGIFIIDTIMDCYLQPKDAWCQVVSNMVNTERSEETKTTQYMDWVTPSKAKLETILAKCF